MSEVETTAAPHYERQLDGPVLASKQFVAGKNTNATATSLQLFDAEKTFGRVNLRAIVVIVLAFDVLQITLALTVCPSWVTVIPAALVDVWAVWYFSGLVREFTPDKDTQFAFPPGEVVRVAADSTDAVIQLNHTVAYKVPLADIVTIRNVPLSFAKVTLKEGESILLPRKAIPARLTSLQTTIQ
ncbi:hypothetical protein [Curtobacterium sp. MCBD17_040]|uniref:hypothetical protein n=1 Tax=Curtobacterium sp. MCBD17_040 TaxID=2175674 RepID=UPI0011B8187E|nr:hypothetical protein [Curtobacterium sp. MCBD17_040]WIB65802.1 hypothetical protein DEI94_16950 [Curtobacterium sp. MCBD17_040]